MGFLLEHDPGFKQRVAEAAERAAALERLNEPRRLQMLIEEQRRRAIADNAGIGQLLDNFPEMNLEEYLKLVAKRTGYEYTVILYTIDEGLKILGSDQELQEKLTEKGVLATTSCSPSTMYFHPEGSSEAKFRRVGVGIRFRREADRYTVEKMQAIQLDSFSNTYYRREFTSSPVIESVDITLMLPRHAFITGQQYPIGISSFRHFDDLVEEGFRKPNRGGYMRIVDVPSWVARPAHFAPRSEPHVGG